MKFNPMHTAIPFYSKSAISENRGITSTAKNDHFELRIGKAFNLVPVGGGDITYKLATNSNAGRREWNISDVKVSAELAETVYDDKNKIIDVEGKQLTPLTSELGSTGLIEKEGLFFHRHTDGQAMAWDSDSTVYVAFRGTANLRDVKQDALLAVSNRSHDAFDDFIIDAANFAKEHGKKLVVTGHSLGANHVNQFASKAALDGRFASLKDASFIGFASPTFSREANVLNIGMKNDPVFGVLSVSTHRYAPKLWGQPQFVDGLKYVTNSALVKNPGAHNMRNIQKSVDALLQFGRLNTNTSRAFLSSTG